MRVFPCRVFACMLLAGFLIASACTRTKGPKQLSASTYDVMRKAVNALNQANRNRNAAAAVYEPAFQDAQRTAEELSSVMGNENSDAYAASQVRRCVQDLSTYRASFEARDKDNRVIEQQLKGLKGEQIQDASGVLSRNAQDLDGCIAEAKEFLSPAER